MYTVCTRVYSECTYAIIDAVIRILSQVDTS